MPPAVLLGLPVHRLATFGRFDHRIRWRDLPDLRDRVALVALGGDLGGRTVTGLGGPCAVVRLLGVFRLLVLLLFRDSQPCFLGETWRNRAARFPGLRMETPSAAGFEEKFSSPWLENGKGTTNP